MRYNFVSQMFKEITVLLLLRKFVWPKYEPCRVCSMSKILKVHNEHVILSC